MFRSRNSRPSEAQELRRKQIDSLKDLVPSAKSVVPDGSMWDVLVHSAKYGQLSFRIILPPTFPERAPEFKLLVQATHHWVTPDLSIVGVPRLAGWNVRTSLGAVARDIAEEFARNPPAPIAVRPSPPPQQQQQHQQQQQPAAAAKARLSVPDSFDELDGLSSAEMEELLVDHERFRDLLTGLACVRSTRARQADLATAVEEAAQKNVSRKEEMEALRAELDEARASHAALRSEYEALSQRQQAVSQTYSVKAMLDALRDAAAAADQASERLVDQFRDDGIEHAAFVREYLRARALYHGRAAKLERIKSQIRH